MATGNQDQLPDSRQCDLCDDPEADRMVQCDNCEKWRHYECVGLNEDNTGDSWQCAGCIQQMASRLQVLAQQRSASQKLLRSTSNAVQSPEVSNAVQAIDEELALIKRERELLAQRRSLVGGTVPPITVSQQPQNGTQQQSDLGGQHQQLNSPMSQRSGANENRTRATQATEAPINTNVHFDPNQIRSSTQYPAPHDSLNDTLVSIHAQHIAARHTIPRDLPNFSGRPEQWPVFYSCYSQTTDLCGFSDQENLMRLQKALTGTARSLVEAQLGTPACVPSIISTLKLVFGRPEFIVQDQLARIRKIPPPKADKLDMIVLFGIAVKNLCTTLEQSKMDEHLKSPFLLQELIDRLPPTMKVEWATYRRNFEPPTAINFSDWLHEKSIDICSVTRISFDDPKQDKSKAQKFTNVHTEAKDDTSGKNKRCFACDNDCTSIIDCDCFKSLTIRKRWELVKAKQLCHSCLKKHRSKCMHPVKCTTDGCTKPHHPMLHNTPKDKSETPQSKKETDPLINCTHFRTPPGIIYRIVPVVLYANSKRVESYAYLDDGSALTMVDTSIARQLALQGETHPLHVQWTGKTKKTINDSMKVCLQISGSFNGAKRFMIHGRTYPGLEITEQTLDVGELRNECPHLDGIPLKSYSNAKVGILIGLENWRVAVPRKIREGKVTQPIAAKTSLGWTVAGPWQTTVGNDALQSCVHVYDVQPDQDNDLNHLIGTYFSLENLGITKYPNSTDSREEKRARQILENSTRRIGNRFETGLLWKSDDINMPDNKRMALTRLQHLERKLLANPDLKAEVSRQMMEYQQNGFIRKLEEGENRPRSNKTWFLPLFTVTNPSKPGKVRIVWDAAAKFSGTSLNSCLLKGPDLVASLLAVLVRFRLHRVAFAGDIKQMFHQVRVIPDDQMAQLFLWRDCDTLRPPDVYATMVLTFGSTSSPCSAQFVKNKNALEFVERSSKAVDSIVNNHYVDDMLDGAETVSQALELAIQVRDIHAEGGFLIRNWRSNSKEFMKAMGDEQGLCQLELKPNPDDLTEKVLGMWWNLEDDCFTFSLRFNKTNQDILTGTRVPTKREVARTLMSVFDPLGLLGHFLVYLKILLQDLWRLGTDWDEPLNNEMLERWSIWIKLLPQIEHVKVPRCYLGLMKDWESITVQLHTFVDASKSALAAVSYLRLYDGEKVYCSLLGSKVKVAPIKLTTIPRLELNAALIGARFASTIRECLKGKLKLQKSFYWCDSTTVLAWIKSAPRFSQYVGFRATEIQEITDPSDWRYVPTKENIADLATKWSSQHLLDPGKKWFTGPMFIYEPETNWPKMDTKNVNTEEELRMTCPIFDSSSIVDIERFSSWKKLLRTMAYVSCFINMGKRRKTKEKNDKLRLESEDWKWSENLLIKMAQDELYSEEISTLKNGGTLKRSSSLYKLTPYLDDDNILRVHGRLEYADVPFNTKRPIIMPSKHRITQLLIDHHHNQFLHRNDETVVNEIRQKFYITQLRRVVKRVRFNCQTCKLRTAKISVPLMAPLLPARLASFTRPFTFTGLDYFGPLLVTVGRRTEKRYGVLFTCLTTRAIHIEIAHTLNTDSCIMAIRNFISRRGSPREFYSDRGTNFIGAEKVLRENVREIDTHKLASEFTTADTTWKFNPPAASHMGGAWERLVRSIKEALYPILPPLRQLNDEVLKSLLIEIEGMINARPLTYVPLTHETEEALTPNHFILGSSNGTKPLGKCDDDGVVLRMTWRTSQQLADHFWKRWIKEYLPTLTRRTKWFERKKPIAPGDVVLIVDERNARNSWPKGIVTNVIVAADGNVRRATIRTASGTMERPVSKLAVLDVYAGDSSAADSPPGGRNVRIGNEIRENETKTN